MSRRVGFVFEVRFKHSDGSRQGATWETDSETLLKRLRAKHEDASEITVKKIGDKPFSFPLDWSKL